jgi:GTPase Era involved in 16S rRNA processing
MENTLKELSLVLKELKLDHLARYISDLYESVDKVHIAFVGEYNAGKSSLINTILGKKVVAERDLPTTNRVVLITDCPVEKREKLDESTELVCVRDPRLSHTVLVDTPGLSSAVKEHEEALMKYLHKADLIVVVAPSNQPFTKEIEELLKLLSERHSSQLAYVINIFEDPSVYEEDPLKLHRLKEFVRERLKNIFSSEDVENTPIFAFSVRAVRKGEKRYPFLTEEWERFESFLFKDVIERARTIKLNAVREKVLKTLGRSSELENLRLRLENLRSEIKRLNELKEDLQKLLEKELSQREKELSLFLEEGFERFEETAKGILKGKTLWDMVKSSSQVVDAIKRELLSLIKKGEFKSRLEKLLDYRPIAVKVRKVYPELLVEPTIPPSLKAKVEEFELELQKLLEGYRNYGSYSKGFSIFFALLLGFGLIFAIFAQGGWRIFGLIVSAVSALGLIGSLVALFSLKRRLEKNLLLDLKRLEKILLRRYGSFVKNSTSERFEITFSHLEAEISKLQRELERLESSLKRLEKLRNELLKG